MRRAASGGALRRVLEQQRIERSFLFLPAVVWPPVDFEFTDAPRTLAISPRERIELKGTSLLREDLSLAQIEAIEAGKDAEGLSALAFPTGGIGAYPTIVDYAADYRAAVATAAPRGASGAASADPRRRRWRGVAPPARGGRRPPGAGAGRGGGGAYGATPQGVGGAGLHHPQAEPGLLCLRQPLRRRRRQPRRDQPNRPEGRRAEAAHRLPAGVRPHRRRPDERRRAGPRPRRAALET